MSNFGKVNEIYAKYYGGELKPARSCVAVKTLPKNSKVEVEVIAIVPWYLLNIHLVCFSR